MPLVSRLISHWKMTPSGVLDHNSTSRSSTVLNWQNWRHTTAELKPAEVKTKTDIGCGTADKMEKGHVPTAFGRNNTETNKTPWCPTVGREHHPVINCAWKAPLPMLPGPSIPTTGSWHSRALHPWLQHTCQLSYTFPVLSQRSSSPAQRTV